MMPPPDIEDLKSPAVDWQVDLDPDPMTTLRNECPSKPFLEISQQNLF
jgi:hypothetical protein